MPETIGVDGQVFEDVLDGYFPLAETVRQCLARNGFGTALLILTQAPILDLPELGPSDPVPLRLGRHRSGLIRRALLQAELRDGGVALCGVADWVWYQGDPDTALSTGHRLAEPAFFRGIGLRPGTLATQNFGSVAEADDTSPVQLLRGGSGRLPSNRQWSVWGFGSAPEGIEPLHLSGSAAPIVGLPANTVRVSGERPGNEVLAVDMADPEHERRLCRMRTDFD